MVGDSGSSLSGGEKQRLAIARALIRDPKILLLDEATNALDSESERSVQEALEKASKGRTTIVIAHRLSTVRNADLLVCMEEGKVVETGTHDQLMMMGKKGGGLYSRLMTTNLRTVDEDFNCNAKVVNEMSLRSQVPCSVVKKRAESKKHEEIECKKTSTNVTLFMLKMNSPELTYILIGCVCCAALGLMQTLVEFYFARITILFSNCDLSYRNRSINRICVLFLVFGVMSMIVQIVSSFSFGISGENLTKRLREALFKLLMRNDVSFFDKEENSVGSLCTMLSSEASAVQGSTGVRIGTVLSNFFILGTGIVLAFIYGWELTLVILAFVPFIIVAGTVSAKLMGGFDAKDKKYLEKAGRYATEASSNIRTVKQLGLESYFANKYVSEMEQAFDKNSKKSWITGLLYGFSNGLIYLIFALGYYAGAHFIANGRMNTEDMMIVFGGMFFASLALGQNQAMAPEHGKSGRAAAKIHEILTTQEPVVDSMSEDGIVPNSFTGNFEFKKINFSYPSRDQVPILKNFDLKIKKGSAVALVGPSGSGKSTLIQLLERYYDPSEGEISLDGINLKHLNLQWYRKHLGLVCQEPILFDWSIAENIAFGDSSRTPHVPIEEIRKVARICNIDHFICGLPDGYETRVGTKGSLISGGQKQRICIARSLIRSPALLLLDEATSALDAENENQVQMALEQATKGRSSLTIAHKLKTIEESDKIHVLNHGTIVESGNHHELLRRNGLYTHLHQLSSR